MQKETNGKGLFKEIDKNDFMWACGTLIILTFLVAWFTMNLPMFVTTF